MKTREDVLHRWTSVMLAMFMILALLPGMAVPAKAEDQTITGPDTVYVAGNSGNDENAGISVDEAVKTMEKAYELVKDGGTIVICETVTTNRVILSAKNVTITSNDGTTDYSQDQNVAWKGLNYIDFQGNTVLKDINLDSNTQGYGFIANGFTFTADEGVKYVGGSYDDIYIIGGSIGSDSSKPDGFKTESGANITVKSGTNWVIYGAGQNRDNSDNTGDIFISISGASTVIEQLSAGFKNEGTEEYTPSEFGNATIDVTDGATVGQVNLSGDLRAKGASKQTDGSTIVLNMGEDTHFGSIILGGLYGYSDGQVLDVSNIVINYYGAEIGNTDNFYFGGAEIGGDGSGSPKETIGEATINLYADLDENCQPIFPGIAATREDSELNTERARINVIDNSKFRYFDLGEKPFYSPKTRIVRYTDSGSEEEPQTVDKSFVPHIIEFASNVEDADLSKKNTNVFKTGEDFVLNGISLDQTSSTIQLVGDNVVPVITATDFVNDYRLKDNGLKNTFVNDGPGKIVLSFLDNDGNTWQPEEGTVVFQVPKASDTDCDGQYVLDMFTAPYMEDGYSLAYRDSEDGTIGQIYIIKARTITFVAGDNGTLNDGEKEISGSYYPGETHPSTPEVTPFEDYMFDCWKDDNGNVVAEFPETVTESATYTAVWKQLKYTLHYNDGRPNDGIWGYNYAEDTNGFYTPDNRKTLPSEVRHFTKADLSGDITYDGVTGPGTYFLCWTREDVEGNTTRENVTPDTDCGDIEYYARWVLVEINVDIQPDINIDVTEESSSDLVKIDDSQKPSLAKNIDLKEDVSGVDCEINITAYVKDVRDASEKASVDRMISEEFGEVKDRIYYDVSIIKTIRNEGKDVSQTELKELSAPIEIQFFIPKKWQSGGDVYMYRSHTASDGTVTTSKLDTIRADSQVYTVSSDAFSTYTMIYVPKKEESKTSQDSQTVSTGVRSFAKGYTALAVSSIAAAAFLVLEKRRHK